MSSFELKILNKHWIKDFDDPEDLCVHGKVYLRIGNEILSDINSYEKTISATALYLLRSLEIDIEIGDFGNQLLPCCGNTFIADGDDYVTILGCVYGVDWEIKHLPNQLVQHRTENDSIVEIPFDEYKLLVLDFVKEVDLFYKKSQPKKIGREVWNKEGFTSFVNEFQALCNKWF